MRADRRALSATRAAALVAQLDPKIVVPMTVCEDEADCDEALKKFLHEMGATPTIQAAGRDDVEPPDRDHHGAPGVARQDLRPRLATQATAAMAPGRRRQPRGGGRRGLP